MRPVAIMSVGQGDITVIGQAQSPKRHIVKTQYLALIRMGLLLNPIEQP